jgi:tripartite-type tricarboxylate transporter receptor subunit TctC
MRLPCNTILAAASGVLAVLLAPGAAGQGYPSKPVRLIVPFVPGGGADTAGRIFGSKLAENLGQQVIHDNRGGGGGLVGASLAAKAPPDGYNLLLGTANMAMNYSLFGKQHSDPVRDFVPICLLASTPNTIAVHPSLPVHSVKDLIALARRSPGQINYASGGNGSTPHLAAELFKSMADIQLVHVPYKGTGPALVAVVSGEAPLIMATALAVLPHVKAGRMRLLAISSLKRVASLPDLPTVNESGVPGYEASQWYGLMAPTGTPEPIVRRLNTEMVKIVKSPDMVAWLAADASIPIGSTPAEFGTYLQQEITKWAKVVQVSGARVD